MDDTERLCARLRTQLVAGRRDWPDWLVFADRLLERGDVRGELIALDHRLATSRPPEVEAAEIRSRASEIEGTAGALWRAGLDLPEGCELWWQYGFVVGVKLREPLGGAGVVSLLEAVARHPSAALLHTLSLSEVSLDEEAVVALSAAGALCGIGVLDLSCDLAGTEGIGALVTSGLLAGLETLALDQSELGDAGVVALAAGVSSSLAHLYLSDAGIGDEGAIALASSESLGGLRCLVLSNNAIGDDGAIALASSVPLGGLEQLYLEENERIGDRGRAALAAPGPCTAARSCTTARTRGDRSRSGREGSTARW